MSGRLSIYRAGEERLTNHETSPTGQEKRGRRPRPFVGRGLLGILAKSAKMGYQLGKRKDYKHMGAKGAMGLYTRRHAPWEV